jgi:hypothetical protein
MTVTIQLDEHFPLSPTAAAKERVRCLAVADAFAIRANDPRNGYAERDAACAADYRRRAGRLQQIANNTAAHRRQA